MKNKRLTILITLLITLLFIFGFIYFKKSNDNNKSNNEVIDKNHGSKNNEILNFLSSIVGVKANNIEIINDPIGFKGELFAPEDSIVRGIDYFLKKTENDKMENLSSNIDKNIISIYVEYKVTKNIKTPIEVKLIPSINDNEDLVININAVRFLDLKIADWIVNMALNSFIEDWFPKDGDFKIDFNKGNVVIYKENFKGILLRDIIIEDNGLRINAIIDLRNINN